jgi:hypothetical protein
MRLGPVTLFAVKDNHVCKNESVKNKSHGIWQNKKRVLYVLPTSHLATFRHLLSPSKATFHHYHRFLRHPISPAIESARSLARSLALRLLLRAERSSVFVAAFVKRNRWKCVYVRVWFFFFFWGGIRWWK